MRRKEIYASRDVSTKEILRKCITLYFFSRVRYFSCHSRFVSHERELKYTHAIVSLKSFIAYEADKDGFFA